MKRVQQGKSASKGSGFGTRPSAGFGGFGGSAAGSSLSYLAEPPSFAAVSDPNVVVSLKNVLKKDSTTRAKALEELVLHVVAHPFDKDGGVEDAILEVWVQLYPRTSIDNSRRVRELSHNLQLELMKSGRKRMERHVPKIVGAWIAGLYDRDRAVSRAADDGLSSFLTSPEKIAAFWRKCQTQILDFAIEAIQETQDTLSDERSTTAEDAEAKFFRVINASLSLVLGLLQKVNQGDIDKARAKYDDYFAQDTVWKTVTFNDAPVRKTSCQLLFVCLDRRLPYADTAKARQAFITGGLKTNLSGSALEYVRAVTKLTQSHPDIWKSSPNDKKSPITRLQAFIAKGSQGSPAKFWECLDQLLTTIPCDTITLDGASSLQTAIKSGVTHREEPRMNTSYAWKCFIDAAERSLQALSPDDQLSFAQKHLFPLLEQFLSTSDKVTSIPMGPNAMSVFVQAHIAILQGSPHLVTASAEEWNRLATSFCARISGSLPEVSKDYQASQEKIGEEGRRWFGLVGHIYGKLPEVDASLPDQTAAASGKVVVQCIALLESRNMKPFGAARVLEYALSTSRHLFDGDVGSRVSSFLLSTASENVDKVAESASLRYLLSCLRLLGSIDSQKDEYGNIWNAWTNAALAMEDGISRDSVIAALISQEQGSGLARRNEQLQETIISRSLATVTAHLGTWELLECAVTYGSLSDESCHKLAKDLIALLDQKSQNKERALRALEIIANSKPELLSQDDDIHTTLVAHLLSLSEINDKAVSSKAVTIRALLDGHNDGNLPVVGIIQSNLERAGPQSLEIDTLVRQAQSANSNSATSEDIFPNTRAWMQELAPFLDQPVNPSLSITNSVGGAATLAVPAKGAEHSPLKVARDRKGRSIPARMALYSSQLFESDAQFAKLPQDSQVQLLYIQSLTVQLVSDQITSLDDNGLWGTLHHPQPMSQAEGLVSALQTFINKQVSQAKWWVTDADDGPSAVVRKLVGRLMQDSGNLSPRGAYSARAFSTIVQTLAEVHGVPSSVEEKLLKTEILKATPQTVLLASALLTGLGETLKSSKATNVFCNRLASDVAGASADAAKTPIILVLLTLCAKIYDPGELPVASNRIVFAVRQITSWLEEPENLENLSASLSADICRALTQLLPSMKDVYGSYWEKSIQFCISLWNRAASYPLAESLPFIHASLRLMRTLETISDPNDDLQDAIKEFASHKPLALIELLKLDRDTSSQPLDIVDAMLCREVETIPLRYIPAPEDIFGLVASESRDIQTAAFNLLHKAIPAQQEQKSVDILLDKTDARLPDELLSLLLNAPTLEKYPDEVLEQFPPPIRSYLLSWKLVFDAFSTSSFKIRNDFTENLKTDDYVEPLLDFMFDVLGHSAAHPLNLDKEAITSQQIGEYNVKLADAESDEKSMHWLLVHLYYLTLKYIPGLFRTWYINCRSKQTRVAVESWTTKYFSPLIISDTLEEVQTWADAQETPAGDEQELLIKVSKTGKEVTAGYEVDEDQAAIAIKIPNSYPIEGVIVSGLHRVAVSETKWQSWIMTTQGVITFSNGNIIDGLQVFKRNIVGALKGQSECAICYSIISTDKRMPDKKCTTCKNLFHRTCLYKWFQTSNQNTCPLCRNPIDYLGADTAKRRQG